MIRPTRVSTGGFCGRALASADPMTRWVSGCDAEASPGPFCLLRLHSWDRPPQRGELWRLDHKVEGAQAEWRCTQPCHSRVTCSAARLGQSGAYAADHGSLHVKVKNTEPANRGDHPKRGRCFRSLGVPLIFLVLLLVLMWLLLLISDIGLVLLNYLFDALM